jgi:D-serine deaminase-like pyridoxal phosphate-dependent protein
VELFQAVDTLPSLRFKGIFTHAGQVYGADSLSEVKEISRHESIIMAETAQAFAEVGTSPDIVSVGSTPTMKVWQGHEGVNEIRPGNYIFHDAIQMSLGAATLEECALSIVSTVISRPEKERAVLDGGSKAFGLDRGAHGKEMVTGFGIVLGKQAILARLSEEHGIMTLDPKVDLDIGEKVRIIPNHACAVVNLFDRAYGLRNGKVVEEFRIAARGKSQAAGRKHPLRQHAIFVFYCPLPAACCPLGNSAKRYFPYSVVRNCIKILSPAFNSRLPSSTFSTNLPKASRHSAQS